jgi:DNA-binding beta-propeller fold protein YncE
MTEQTFVAVASVASDAILQFDPTQAGTNGFDENGFRDAFTPGESSILLYDGVTGEFIDEIVPAGTAEENISVASGVIFGPDGLLYALDQGTNSVKSYDILTGNFVETLVYSDSTGLDSSTLVRPEGLIFDPETGDLYVSSLAGGGVQLYDGETGELLQNIVTNNPNGDAFAAAGLIFDPEGESLYIGSVFNDNRIVEFNTETGELTTFIGPDEAQPIPSFPIFGLDGNFLNGTFSSDAIGFPPTDIRRYDAETGELIDVFVEPGNNLAQASRLVLGPDNELYVTSFGSDRVLRYDGETGEFIDEFISPGEGGLANPGGLAFTTLDIQPENVYGTIGNDNIQVNPDPTDSEQLLPTPKVVFAGEGDDIIDAAVLSGNLSLEHRLMGQSGNDTLIAGYNSVLLGGEGNDTLDASMGRGNIRVAGDEGDDVLLLGSNGRFTANGGNDSFFAGTGGNNTLIGDAGADTFWLANNGQIVESANIITDFDDADLIGIGGLGITSTDGLGFAQDGADVLISVNDSQIGRVLNIEVDELTADGNFVFA